MKRRRVSPGLVRQVQDLLKSPLELTHREIAARLGRHASTVSLIAKGEHVSHEVEALRCPGCGGRITIRPCLKCQIERNPDGA